MTLYCFSNQDVGPSKARTNITTAYSTSKEDAEFYPNEASLTAYEVSKDLEKTSLLDGPIRQFRLITLFGGQVHIHQIRDQNNRPNDYDM